MSHIQRHQSGKRDGCNARSVPAPGEFVGQAPVELHFHPAPHPYDDPPKSWRRYDAGRSVRTTYDHEMSAPNTASLLQGAQRALSEGNARKAADLSRKALRYEPRNADAVYFLGLAHALNGELVPAIERWRQVLQLNPRQFAAHANL